jgi:RNA polymerase sigma-70 factor (ECF subfamily)
MSPSPLEEAFRHSLSPALQGQFDAGLDATLDKLIATAREAWPTLELDAPAFVAHAAERLQPEVELASLHAADLWLAFACLLGDPAALAAFDRTVLARVPAVLRGTLPPGLTEDDVLQNLRLKLFVRKGETPPQIASYSGRGPLLQWLRASAVRLTQDYARTRKLEVADPDAALADTPAAVGGAELGYLKDHFGPDFKAAFQEALLSLSPKDQNLLRLYYLDGSSPEEIGRLYETHRTTVWRWLSQCREALLAQTRKNLVARVKVSDGEVSSLMNAVHSQLDVSLSRMLRKP